MIKKGVLAVMWRYYYRISTLFHFLDCKPVYGRSDSDMLKGGWL